jgi:hypothetical protein
MAKTATPTKSIQCNHVFILISPSLWPLSYALRLKGGKAAL